MERSGRDGTSIFAAACVSDRGHVERRRIHARCVAAAVPALAACCRPARSRRRSRCARPLPRRRVAASPPAARSSGVGGGARGGATTAAARGDGEPGEVRPDPLTQARADCWMKVESQKDLRGIDQRIAFVDKCVADQLKSKPSP